jgi:hypothetical protein
MEGWRGGRVGVSVGVRVKVLCIGRSLLTA